MISDRGKSVRNLAVRMGSVENYYGSRSIFLAILVSLFAELISAISELRVDGRVI